MADLRPVPDYVACLVAQDLRGKRRPRRPTSPKPGDNRWLAARDTMMPMFEPQTPMKQEGSKTHLTNA